MVVELSVGKIEIIDSLTWGQQEQLRSVMYSGVKLSGIEEDNSKIDIDGSFMAKSRYKALEIAIKKITLNDGKEISYSQEWMDNLTIEDGDKLFTAVDSVTSKKK